MEHERVGEGPESNALNTSAVQELADMKADCKEMEVTSGLQEEQLCLHDFAIFLLERFAA